MKSRANMLKIHRGTPCYNIHPQSWYTTFFGNFDSKIVVVPSRMWLPVFHPRLSGAVLAQGP